MRIEDEGSYLGGGDEGIEASGSGRVPEVDSSV